MPDARPLDLSHLFCPRCENKGTLTAAWVMVTGTRQLRATCGSCGFTAPVVPK